MFYIALYVITLLLGYLQKTNLIINGKKLNIYLALVYIICVFLATFRADSVGNDLEAYLDLFEIFSKGFSINEVVSHSTSTELAYLVFIKFISSLTQSRYIFLGIHAIITYGLIFSFLARYSENLVMSNQMFISLIFVGTFNISRQYLSISFFLYAYSLYEQKKYFRTLAFILLSILFHKSSIVLLVIFIIKHWKFNRKKILLLEIVLLLLWLIFSDRDIVNVFFNTFGYGKYIGTIHLMGSVTRGILSYIYLLIVIMGILGTFLIKIDDDKYYFQLYISSIGTMFSILASKVVLFGRVGVGFVFFQLLYLPKLINQLFSKKSRRVITIIVYILLGIAMYVSGLTAPYRLHKVLII